MKDKDIKMVLIAQHLDLKQSGALIYKTQNNCNLTDYIMNAQALLEINLRCSQVAFQSTKENPNSHMQFDLQPFIKSL